MLLLGAGLPQHEPTAASSRSLPRAQPGECQKIKLRGPKSLFHRPVGAPQHSGNQRSRKANKVAAGGVNPKQSAALRDIFVVARQLTYITKERETLGSFELVSRSGTLKLSED